MRAQIAQPLWYHPTSVMLIDDNVKLLKPLGDQIDSRFPFLAYTNPKEALEYLKQHILPLQKLSQEIISDIDPSEKQHLSSENVAINFTPLRTHLDKPDRFTLFVTVVVDKVMHEMDGLDFCREVRKLGLPIKLILLTGNAGAEEAIAAFNDRIIDAFVQKTTPNMMSQINQQIKALAFQAFCDSSTQLAGPILNKFPLLNSDVFVDFFSKIIEENNVTEYYLLDSSCSYLLLTANGNAKILLIKSPIDFKNAYDIASSDDNSKPDVLEALRNHTAFPFTGTKGSYFSFDPGQWENVMVPMKKQSDLDLYYTVVEQPESVLSFDHYTHKIWKPKIV